MVRGDTGLDYSDMSIIAYTLAQAILPGQAADVHPLHIHPHRAVREHTHADFCEVMWLSQGSLRHQVNGQQTTFSTGDVILVRQEDRHLLAAIDEHGALLHNIAFPTDWLQGDLAPTESWFPGGGVTGDRELPLTLRLTANDLVTLLALETTVLQANADRVAVLAYVATLKTIAQHADAAISDMHTVPAWLDQLRHDMREPAALRQGRRALSQLSGRSLAHVSRQWKEHFQQTPSVFINQHRIEWARQRLQSTDEDITSIAYDCGFNDLSYFYRQFQRQIGRTPGAMRRQQLYHDEKI